MRPRVLSEFFWLARSQCWCFASVAAALVSDLFFGPCPTGLCGEVVLTDTVGVRPEVLSEILVRLALPSAGVLQMLSRPLYLICV